MDWSNEPKPSGIRLCFYWDPERMPEIKMDGPTRRFFIDRNRTKDLRKRVSRWVDANDARDDIVDFLTNLELPGTGDRDECDPSK